MKRIWNFCIACANILGGRRLLGAVWPRLSLGNMVTGVIILLLPSFSLAEVPPTISYQGVLKDAQWNAVPDGNFNVTFSIYDDSLAGNLLWSEQQALQTTDGLFHVNLGKVNSIPDSALQSLAFVAFQIEGQPEMSPRVALQSVPYSYQSKKSQFADDADRVDGFEGAVLEESQEIVNTVNQHTIDYGHLTVPQMQELTTGGFTTLHNHSIVPPENMFRATQNSSYQNWVTVFTVPSNKIRFITNIFFSGSMAVRIGTEVIINANLLHPWQSGAAGLVMYPSETLEIWGYDGASALILVTGYEFDYVPQER